MIRGISIAIGLLTLVGCSNHPLPQDATGSSTEDIVARIRCEAREALRLSALKEMSRYSSEILLEGKTGADLVSYLREDLDRFNELKTTKLKNKEIEAAFEYFRKAQIAFEFSLDLSESNTQGVSVDFIRSFSRRVDNLGIGAKGERTRQTIRRFKIIDNFLVLTTGINPTYCSEPRPINLVYPTEGGLKILDLVDSFIFINKNGSIKGTPTGPAIREMGDTIVFSTKFIGSVSPVVALNPTQLYGFELSRFSVTNDNYRQDRHQVIITATLPDLKSFPYYKGASSGEFASGDPRLLAAEASIQQIRKNNVEDAITQIGNSLGRYPLP